MRMLRWLGYLAAIAAVACSGSSGVDRPSATPATSSAAAAATTTAAPSGTIVVYSTIAPEFATPLQQAFTKAQPGIKVEFIQLRPAEVLTRLQAEKKAGTINADLVMMAMGPESSQLRADGFFAPYRSANESAIEDVFKSDDHKYVVPLAYFQILGYNTKLLTTKPESWQDLVSPAVKGRVAITDARAGGGNYTFAYNMWQLYGKDFFTKLADNGVLVAGGGHGDIVNRLTSGQIALGVSLTYMVSAAAQKGAPIAPIFPKEGAGMIPYWMSILAAGKNSPAARVFYDYVLSEAGQVTLRDASGYYAVRKGVTAPKGLPDLASVKVLPLDVDKFVSQSTSITAGVVQALSLK